VFAGNVSDVKTLQQIVESVERRYGKAQRIWVMDRGVSSKKNVAWLEQEGRMYVVATPRSEWKRWRAQFEDPSGWQVLRDDVEGKRCVADEGKLSFVLCRSAQRRLKEKAMHQRFATRIDAALKKLERRIARSKRPLERAPIERQLGRLLPRMHACRKDTISLSFACIRVRLVLRTTTNLPDFRVFEQMCVNPRKSKVSGLPRPCCLRVGAAKRPNSISRVLSPCSSSPNLLKRSRKSWRNRSPSAWICKPTMKSSAYRTTITSLSVCVLLHRSTHRSNT
jgi:hypothetical protein